MFLRQFKSTPTLTLTCLRISPNLLLSFNQYSEQPNFPMCTIHMVALTYKEPTFFLSHLPPHGPLCLGMILSFGKGKPTQWSWCGRPAQTNQDSLCILHVREKKGMQDFLGNCVTIKASPTILLVALCLMVARFQQGIFTAKQAELISKHFCCLYELVPYPTLTDSVIRFIGLNAVGPNGRGVNDLVLKGQYLEHFQPTLQNYIEAGHLFLRGPDMFLSKDKRYLYDMTHDVRSVWVPTHRARLLSRFKSVEIGLPKCHVRHLPCIFEDDWTLNGSR